MMRDKELWLRTAVGISIVGFLMLAYGVYQWSDHDVTTSIPDEFSNDNYKVEAKDDSGEERNTPYTEITAETLPKLTASASKTIYKEETQISQREKLTRIANPMKEPIQIEQRVLYPVRPQDGEEMGTLILPALNKQMPIIHGTDEDQLERGVGHYKGSVLPGEPDHTILSGHRDTVFRSIGKLNLGDAIVVTTKAGEFDYEIVETYIVDKDDKTVIKPTEGATLSLTTCYPFSFIGSAPERYIIKAVLVKAQLNE